MSQLCYARLCSLSNQQVYDIRYVECYVELLRHYAELIFSYQQQVYCGQLIGTILIYCISSQDRGALNCIDILRNIVDSLQKYKILTNQTMQALLEQLQQSQVVIQARDQENNALPDLLNEIVSLSSIEDIRIKAQYILYSDDLQTNIKFTPTESSLRSRPLSAASGG